MRVIAGKARRHKLIAPEGKNVRPTTDRTKETLFNIINMKVLDSHVLDLFSGSGAIGIEALSRGAKKCTFVENNVQAVKCINQNLDHTDLIELASILSHDVVKSIKTLSISNEHFDIIFLDPPYNKGWEENIITLLAMENLLNDDGLLICESSIETSFKFTDDLPLNIIKEKEFKTSKFTFIESNKFRN